MRRHFVNWSVIYHPKQYVHCAQCFSQSIVHISMSGVNKKITSLALIFNIDASGFMEVSPERNSCVLIKKKGGGGETEINS